MASASASAVTKTVLQQGNLPEEITNNIIDTKLHLERVEKTKRALQVFHNYYQHFQQKLPEDWMVNDFQDFINILKPIIENKDFLNEAWFKKYHRALFYSFLRDFQEALGLYGARQFGKGSDEFVMHVIKVSNQNVTAPLTEMKKQIKYI